ncbi:hypothetical protein GGS21DRAFT_485952 [Xylaria nigripes]|nr:hypothetical protein GGS21DRAFT_485952 [Xylaria nigripes]
MSPSPGDGAPPSQDAKLVGGFASVFKGLAGAAKLTKSAPTSAQTVPDPTSHSEIAEQLNGDAVAQALPPQYISLYEQLKDGTVSERVAAAHALRGLVSDYPLNPVLDIWSAAKDLIASTNPKAARITGWELLIECVKHPHSSDLERKEYFQTVSSIANPEDFHLQLAALISLSNHGRDVSGFDYDLFPLLSTWLRSSFKIIRTARSTAKKQGSRSKGKFTVIKEEKDLADLFAFVTDTVKFNYVLTDDRAAEALVDSLLDICRITNHAEDMRSCIGVLDAIITFGVLPGNKLNMCVSILSSIHCLVPDAQKVAWHTICNICRSHHGQAALKALLDTLLNASGDEGKKKNDVREIRGALSVLARLVLKSSEKGYPAVPYAVLVNGLSKVVEVTSAWKIHLDIIRLVNALFCDGQGSIDSRLVDQDWTLLFNVVATCSADAIALSAKSRQVIASPSSQEDKDHPEASIIKELSILVSRVEDIVKDHPGPLIQRPDCIMFFAKIHPAIPDSAAGLILDYYTQFRCCYPSDAQWKMNLELVLNAFFRDRNCSTIVRSRALHAITEVYDMLELISNEIEPDFVSDLVKRLLSGVEEEMDIVVLQEIVSFAASVATTAKFPMFCHIIDTLSGIVGGNQQRPVASSSLSQGSVPPPTASAFPASQTLGDVVTKGFVQIFLRVMNVDVSKSIRLFNILVSISKKNNEIDARLTAMKFLFRVRADWANRIFITTYTETNSLATTLRRTEAAMTRNSSDATSQQTRSSRSETGGLPRSTRGLSFSQGQLPPGNHLNRMASGTKPGSTTYQPLWIASDSDALPEAPSSTASPVLYSTAVGASPEEGGSGGEDSLLPMGLWLETILQLIQAGCDWEVYSFILVHLPSQLRNHAVFNSAVPQLQELRRVVCDQIKQNIFQEPPSNSGLRKADIAICLLHALTMILSYHRHFQKPEEDEIVMTFVQAITTWERSAKCCIHALTICCHELPFSTGKVLMTILHRMAQIITQPYVAMHILEFLACLSRLPSLYVNFRKEEYQTVFGICVRYLQFVRGKKQSNRANSTGDTAHSGKQSLPADNLSHPNASDDLPQYVYTLAYHVIVFWFLALKLEDRASHVSWIAKNLFTDVDGSQVIDEQAQTSLDFMQRVTYADVDESAIDPLFTPDRFGEIIKKRWLIGNSIVTVEQAVRSGWAQITKRQPSGTSWFIICESFRPPPAHQHSPDDSRDIASGSANCVLPNHILVQLLSSVPQYNDMTKPIPLPQNDSVDMAIRVFDRNSTVDSHKVGIIYIGENQVDEAEILANISGSSEYVAFLNGLGTLTKLKGATFNTQGLDRQYDTDGEYTFCWRDRVTEVVFHVTTQMPTDLKNDRLCTQKKRHIGNDFVNIIWNDSGLPFKFNTFPSDFNYVYIVITPESRASFVATRRRTPKDVEDSFYKVLVMSRPGFPEISPASETKIVSLKALPEFIRLLALNASFFSHVWAKREGNEHISSWGNRLAEINRLREKYGSKPASSPSGTAHSPGHALTPSIGSQLDILRPGSMVRDSLNVRRSSVITFLTNSSEQNSHRSSMLTTASTDNTEGGPVTTADTLVESLDYSRWA